MPCRMEWGTTAATHEKYAREALSIFLYVPNVYYLCNTSVLIAWVEMTKPRCPNNI